MLYLNWDMPEEMKNFLVIEDCSNFPIDRYVLTPSENQIAKDIVKMRTVVPKLKEMNIDYLNATLLYGDPGTGKAQPLDAGILTPDGFKKMGDIAQGDRVMTPSGGIAEVINIYPQGEMDIYEVVFDDGSRTRCTRDHLWEITRNGQRRIETLADILKESEGKENLLKEYSIRNILPPVHEQKVFKIPPAEYGKALALDIVTVDERYLYGDCQQRTEFLNSYIRNAGEKVVRQDDSRTYIHLDEHKHDTAEYIVKHARSLGLGCVMKRPEDREDPGYDIRIIRGNGTRRIKKITHAGRKECQCIYINDPEHLYITDDYIPTHNTTFGRYMAYKLGLDFAFIQFANIMSGSMGDTSKNITKIFDIVKDKKCIFMMDEIDAISAKRHYDSSSGSGEMGRITITVMQELDKLKRRGTGTIIIAATNIHTSFMDEALVSRFPIVKKIRTWTNREKEAYIHKFLASTGLPIDEQMIQKYVASHSSLPQRGIEADIIRAAAEWIASGQKKFELVHIREKELE